MTRRTLWPRGRTGRWLRGARRWAELAVARQVPAGLRVFYGHDRLPEPGGRVTGATAKIQKLAARFPNHPSGFSLLYLASNWLPRDVTALVRLARRRGIPFVLNQDGVAYPGWAGDRVEEVNRHLRNVLSAADHVIYQSEFCKLTADRFLGETSGSWEVLPNAVDTTHFAPADAPPPAGPVLLLGGDQTQGYRIDLALRTLAALLPAYPQARLLITGEVGAPLAPTIAELAIEGHVELSGLYAQRDAPALFRRAHLLLHTKVNDPCPTVVLEAMASGLPVVYPASGGTPELVGDEAGVGVPHPDGFEQDEPPSPAALAEAIAHVLGSLPTYAQAARRRAVERYELTGWLERHAALFAELTGSL